MRILKHDWKGGVATIIVESPDDLWILKTVIQPGDSVRGSTERKMKVGGGGGEGGSVVRKRMTLTVKAEKVEYAPDGSSLRVLGVITDGPDDVPRGEHHSLSLEPGSQITIMKESWPRYLVGKLEAATKQDAALLVLLFDREEAKLFGVTRRGVEELVRLRGKVAKKAVDEKQAVNFYQEIVAALAEHDARGKYSYIVAGAPAFWREYLEKELPAELRRKTVLTTISAVERTAIRELLARPEVAKLLRENSTMREMGLVEEALAGLAKGRLAYGLPEIEDAALQGNVAAIIVTENAIAKARNEGRAHQLEALLRQCESTRGEVHILGSDEAMGKIDGLGGVVAMKRW